MPRLVAWLSRWHLLLFTALIIVSGGFFWSLRSRTINNPRLSITQSTVQLPDPIDMANNLYGRDQYFAATTAFERLRQAQPDMDLEFCWAAALSAYHSRNFSHSVELLASVKTPDDDDLRLLVLCEISTGKTADAINTSKKLDREVLEQIRICLMSWPTLQKNWICIA